MQKLVIHKGIKPKKEIVNNYFYMITKSYEDFKGVFKLPKKPTNKKNDV